MFLALDVGNVIFEVDRRSFKESLKPFCKDPQKFIDDIDGLLDTGLTNLEQAIRLYGILPSHDDASSFLETWNAALKPNPKMMAWVESLKSADVDIAILSNMGLDHAAYIKRTWPGFFDGCKLHLSCEVGARKPSKLYFNSFNKEQGSLWTFQWPLPILYIDDRSENLSQGENFGFKPCRFKLEEFVSWSNEKQDKYLDMLFDRIVNNQ